MQVWEKCDWSPGRRDSRRGTLVPTEQEGTHHAVFWVDGLLKGVKDTFDEEGTGADTRAQAGFVCCRPRPVELTFCPVGPGGLASPDHPSQAAGESGVPCGIQSAKASLRGSLWVRAHHVLTCSSIRHHSHTPSIQLFPFCPRHWGVCNGCIYT